MKLCVLFIAFLEWTYGLMTLPIYRRIQEKNILWLSGMCKFIDILFSLFLLISASLTPHRLAPT